MVNNPDFEPAKMSPHSQEAEEAVLGSIIINPDAYLEVSAFLKKEDFFILRNGWVWEAMTRLHKRSEIIEYLTIIEELRTQGRLNDVGGAAYITFLAMETATSTHAETYARIVERAALRRRMLKSAAEIAELARDEDKDIHTCVHEATRAMEPITRALSNDHEPTLAEIVDVALNDVAMEAETNPRAIVYPVNSLNNLLGYALPGDLVIPAARSGVGKSRFLLQTFLINGKRKKKCLFMSTELTREQVVHILIEMQSKTGITAIAIRDRRLTKNQQSEYYGLAQELLSLPIHIIGINDWSVEKVRSRLLRDGVGHWDLVAVDYIQRLCSVQKFEKEYELYGYIAKKLKNTALEFSTVVMSPSQTNRDSIKSGQGGANLAGSDGILRESDITLMISRPELHDQVDASLLGKAKIKVEKGRFGSMGQSITCDFHATRGTYDDTEALAVPEYLQTMTWETETDESPY